MRQQAEPEEELHYDELIAEIDAIAHEEVAVRLELHGITGWRSALKGLESRRIRRRVETVRRRGFNPPVKVVNGGRRSPSGR